MSELKEFDLLNEQNLLTKAGMKTQFEIQSDAVKALYTNPDLIVPTEQDEIVYRHNWEGKRYYYSNIDIPNITNKDLYPSVTTIESEVLADSCFLKKWMVDSFDNIQEYHNYMKEKADYGTFMHTTFEQFLVHNYFPNTEQLEFDIKTYMDANSITSIHPKSWITPITKALISFDRFLVEKKVTPIAVELPLISKTMGYAGALDLVCQLEFNRKTIPCIIDFKSGASWDSHPIQLKAYKDLYNEKHNHIDHIFNWHPNDWAKPTGSLYKLINQTDSPKCAEWKPLLELYKLKEEPFKPKMIFNGQLTRNMDIEDIIVYVTPQDEVRQKFSIRDMEESV